MEIKIEIPRNFEAQFNNDRFNDSFERICVEIGLSDKIMAGLYEVELIRMLQNAMTKAEVSE